MNDIQKCIVSVTGLICLTALQIVAWASGHNGSVFALTSTGIGGIIGFALGIKVNINNGGQKVVSNK